ncbi:MAG: UDP-glucose/GDP-mannose dehydrogenase family protein [Armatimonadetes bacterium]|nr:UDP-glucose/GDP-mannose dehydrogenase family protein [Armatimonadota bacterium]
MKVTVVGAGYVGLTAAACLCHSGHEVSCIEKDQIKLAGLRSGRLPFFEEGLPELVHAGLAKGALRFGASLKEGLDAEVLMVAVGTPARPDGRIDLTQIYAVLADLVEQARSPLLIAMKSTVPPGFGLSVEQRFLQKAAVPLGYVANPEFLREGTAVRDWFQPDRIIIGGSDEEVIAKMARLYADLKAPLLTMDIGSAEMVKYAANAFLATKISFINEIANLCELVGADILPVARAVGLDRRIGGQFLAAGLGYGGSCFPKDTSALDFVSACNGYAFNLLKAVIEVNNRQRLLVLRKLKKALGRLTGITVGVLGLAFKPGTDDVRESPALDVINLLLDEGACVRAYDPLALPKAGDFLPASVFLAGGALDAAAGCHALLVVTEWPEFIDLDWMRVKQLMCPPYLVLDGRNCLPAEELKKNGFLYLGIGRARYA